MMSSGLLGRTVVCLITSVFLASFTLLAFGQLPERTIRGGKWVWLCGATGIINSSEDAKTHSGEALEKQLGTHLDVVKPFNSEFSYTEVYALRGHIQEAQKAMVEVARKNGYVLRFPDGTKFDPRTNPVWSKDHQ